MKPYISPILSVFIFQFFVFSAACQQPIEYPFLKDDTVLKKTYLTQIKNKKESILTACKGNSYSKEYKEIYEEHFKSIEKFIQGNCALTEPVVNGYLQQIIKKLMDANPELKGMQVRVVFSRDWWPNAYSMGDGTIAFNAGLFLFLDNEAELEFVLAHEFSHYYLDHMTKAITKEVETENSKEFQAKLKELAKKEYERNKELENLGKSVLFNTRKHSREYEAEADRYAFRFLKNTEFDVNAARTCLELLDKIDDSLLLKPLVPDKLFNFADYPFKKKWTEKESAIFSAMNEDDSPLSKKEKDSLKTHPDCSKRILLLDDSIKSVSNSGRKKFLVNEILFRQLKNQLFVEEMEHCYVEDDLSRNLYFASLLFQSDNGSQVAIYSIARSLNKIYECQKAHTLGNKMGSENRYNSADYNQLLRMLNKVRLDEIANINYRFCNAHAEQMKDYKHFDEEMKKAEQYTK